MRSKWRNFGLILFLMLLVPGYSYAYGSWGAAAAPANNGMGFLGGIGTSILMILIVVVVLFLIAREIVCWYWKINENVSLLKEIRDLLKNNSTINPVLATAAPSTTETPHVLAEGEWKCLRGHVNPAKNTKCSTCGRAPDAVL